MDEFSVIQADGLEDEIGLLEVELGLLMKKLMKRDLFASERIERVLREQKRRELGEVECGRICRM